MNAIFCPTAKRLHTALNEKNSAKSTYLPIAVTILAIVCFAAAKTWDIAQLQYIGALVLVLAVLIVDETTALYLILIIVPSTYYTKIGASSVCGYLCILVLCKAVVAKRKLPSTNIIFCMFVMLMFCLCTALINSETSIIIQMIKMASYFLLFSLILKNNRADKSMCIKLCRGYCLGVFVSLTLGIIYYLVQGRSIIAYYDYRFSGLCIDPNYFSSTLMFSIAIILSLSFMNGKIRIKDICLFLYFSIFGIVTLSRAFILTYAVIILLTVLYFLFTRQISLTAKIAVIAFFVLVLFLLREQVSVIISDVMVRFSDNTVASGGGRLQIWSFYLNNFASSIPTFFLGTGSASKYIVSGVIRSAEHSAYVELLSTYGICGFLSVLFAYLSINKSIKQYFPTRRLRMTNCLPLLAVLLVNTFISLSTNENFIFGIMLSFLCVHISTENNCLPKFIT